MFCPSLVALLIRPPPLRLGQSVGRVTPPRAFVCSTASVEPAAAVRNGSTARFPFTRLNGRRAGHPGDDLAGAAGACGPEIARRSFPLRIVQTEKLNRPEFRPEIIDRHRLLRHLERL